MDWIKQREDAVGTMQILLLTFDTFDAEVYYSTSPAWRAARSTYRQMHVFKTLTGNNEVYSVFYGEYDSRRPPSKAIGEPCRRRSGIPRRSRAASAASGRKSDDWTPKISYIAGSL